MFRYVVNALIALALAVWIGSLVFFGTAVAPVVFDPALIASRTIAGAINASILSRLGVVETVCGILVVGGAIYGVYRTGSWLSWGVLVLALFMTATSFYNNNVAFPRLNELRISIGSFDHIAAEKLDSYKLFQQGHGRYSTLVRLVLVAGVLALILHTAALVNYRVRMHHLGWLAESGPFRDHIDTGDDEPPPTGRPPTPAPDIASK